MKILKKKCRNPYFIGINSAIKTLDKKDNMKY